LDVEVIECSLLPYEWRARFLFEEDCHVELMNLKYFLDSYSFDQDQWCAPSAGLANLAELFSSFGKGYKYDRHKTEIWCKPIILKLWMMTALHRGFKHCRICLHSAGSYTELRDDFAGSDAGFGVALSDHVAVWYQKQRNGEYPQGSCVVGLLLTASYVDRGVYEKLTHLHNATPVYSEAERAFRGFRDMVVVRDRYMWLPLGLAVAME
jgi:hypothetical protein